MRGGVRGRVHARHPWTMAVVMGLPRFRAYAGRFVELLSGTTTYAALFASLGPTPEILKA